MLLAAAAIGAAVRDRQLCATQHGTSIFSTCAGSSGIARACSYGRHGGHYNDDSNYGDAYTCDCNCVDCSNRKAPAYRYGDDCNCDDDDENCMTIKH